jgi:hypothetical protein
MVPLSLPSNFNPAHAYFFHTSVASGIFGSTNQETTRQIQILHHLFHEPPLACVGWNIKGTEWCGAGAFDSENSNRDAHLLEVVEALKYPNISFYSTSITESKKGELDVKGVLQFHGVNKEISFKATAATVKGNTQVAGHFIFLIEDFKIERPSFMLKPVDNEVKIKFEVVY